MGRLALKDVGIGFSQEERQSFRSDPVLQETAFHAFTMQNHKTLSKFSKKYRSLSSREQLGILALAHNAGAGGALDYLRSGVDTVDGFGTKGTRYVNAVANAFNQGGRSMSSAETSFNYDNTVWECVLLPYRIIVCNDGIQYIVQLREEIKYRNLSFHMNWSGIAKRYPQIAMAGLPDDSPGLLEDESA